MNFPLRDNKRELPELPSQLWMSPTSNYQIVPFGVSYMVSLRHAGVRKCFIALNVILRFCQWLRIDVS
ncbi:hypothetical protein Y032_0042g634 [Ancylostoma ceylanicum]|uniref:Uncharacterized protein n=1 Tax=Ancylostoma ceylanicum TaxID=53326 RepID=A0A016UFP1_9BILA|nr:hypothetical protein Y032_0042g634 [Ancylostoma ceylanicum]